MAVVVLVAITPSKLLSGIQTIVTNQPNQNDSSRTVWQLSSEWIARTLAIVLMMVAPGLVGAWADKQLSTNFLSLIGFGVGLAFGLVGLIVLAKRLTPPARGKSLEWPEAKKSESSAEGNEKSRAE